MGYLFQYFVENFWSIIIILLLICFRVVMIFVYTKSDLPKAKKKLGFIISIIIPIIALILYLVWTNSSEKSNSK